MEQQEIYWGIVNKNEITLRLSVDCKNTVDQISSTQGLLMEVMHYPRQHPETNTTTLARAFLAEVHGLYTNIGDEPLNYLGRVMTYGIKYARDYNKKQIETSEGLDNPLDRFDKDIDQELWDFYIEKKREVGKRFPNIKDYFQKARTLNPKISQSGRLDEVSEKELVLELMKQGIQGYMELPKHIRLENMFCGN